MSEVIVDGRLRLIVESNGLVSIGPGWKLVWVTDLELIMVNQKKGVVFIPVGSEVQVYGEIEPPMPPPPMPPEEGSVIDAGQKRSGS